MIRSAVVPHSAEEMYALVNDIESYPRFLPWCSAAKILSQAENRLTASITLALGGIRQTFTTENTMVPGCRIDVCLLSGPFRHLSGHWAFSPAGEASSTVELEMQFEFKSRALQYALRRPFNHILNTFVDLFRRRAAKVYGKN